MTIGEASDGFYKVTVNGSQGYVATKYLASEKVTQSAEVTPAPTTPTTPSGTRGSTTTKPSTSTTTTTTKPSSTTTTTKPSTSTTTPTAPTTKPSTPAPAPTPAPTTPSLNTDLGLVPFQSLNGNCPYRLNQYTTYQGHYGFFWSMQQPDQTKRIAMQQELYQANMRFDSEKNEWIYPTEQTNMIGYYGDTWQTMFTYMIPN